MSEYIKKEDILSAAVEVEYLGRPRMIVSVAKIGQMQTIDIVRCKECRWYDDEDYGEPTRYCTWHESVVNPDDFCSYGDRKTEPNVVMPKKCKGCDSASKIIEAYSRGYTDGADAVKKIAEQTILTTDCSWK